MEKNFLPFEQGSVCCICGKEYLRATKDRWGNIHFDKCPGCLGGEYKPRKKSAFGKILSSLTGRLGLNI